MASIAFTGCDVFYAAHGSAQPAVRRREVIVNGRRVKTVDVHSHCVIPEALARLGLKAETQRRGLVLVMADRLSEMDEQGIDVEALSINPFWYKADSSGSSTSTRSSSRQRRSATSWPERAPARS